MPACSRGATRPSCNWPLAPFRDERAQGRPGARCTRDLVCNVHKEVRTRAYRSSGEHPAFPAQWFDGLWRALPGDEFLLPPSLTDWRLIESPVEPDNLHQLDTSNGCQDHTVLPSAASSSHPPRPARMLPEEVSTKAFKRRSSAAPPITHGPKPALRSHQRSGRCRVHRIPSPTSVTIAIRPSCGPGWREF